VHCWCQVAGGSVGNRRNTQRGSLKPQRWNNRDTLESWLGALEPNGSHQLRDLGSCNNHSLAAIRSHTPAGTLPTAGRHLLAGGAPHLQAWTQVRPPDACDASCGGQRTQQAPDDWDMQSWLFCLRCLSVLLPPAIGRTGAVILAPRGSRLIKATKAPTTDALPSMWL
jgi:hypothetical protein